MGRVKCHENFKKISQIAGKMSPQIIHLLSEEEILACFFLLFIAALPLFPAIVHYWNILLIEIRGETHVRQYKKKTWSCAEVFKSVERSGPNDVIESTSGNQAISVTQKNIGAERQVWGILESLCKTLGLNLIYTWDQPCLECNLYL